LRSYIIFIRLRLMEREKNFAAPAPVSALVYYTVYRCCKAGAEPPGTESLESRGDAAQAPFSATTLV
jgi:hypothetical protein